MGRSNQHDAFASARGVYLDAKKSGVSGTTLAKLKADADAAYATYRSAGGTLPKGY